MFYETLLLTQSQGLENVDEPGMKPSRYGGVKRPVAADPTPAATSCCSGSNPSSLSKCLGVCNVTILLCSGPKPKTESLNLWHKSTSGQQSNTQAHGVLL